jgi:ABC-2 type transport system ATP-binding protein
VDNISFHVEKGEIVGFLGPNAAGKTTTMRILTGFLGPTQGNVWIGGYDVILNSLEARQHVGYLPEAVPLYGDMTVRSYLEFSARLRGLGKNKIKRRTDDVVAMCHLEEYIDVLIGKLSKGFRQRVGVAQAILHEPEVLILDEPTIGIDPIQVAMTRELIRELGKEHTVLLSTHILPEVSLICERVIILHEGKIVAEGSIGDLSSMIGGAKRIRLKVEGPAEKVTERLRQIDGIRQVQFQGPHHLIECSEERDPRTKIMEAIVQGGWTLLSLESVEMTLEDIFLKLTTEEEREE